MSNSNVALVQDGFAPPRVFEGASVLQVAFSFAAMLGMCLVAWMFYALRSFNVDPDIWWHIKVGETILTAHRWPTTDPYSFTAAGQPWVAFEWLGDVLLASVYGAGGLRGLGALLIILGSLFALALYYYTTLRCGNPKAGFLATAILLNLANGFNLRPQMLGYLFVILTLIALERFRQGKRRMIWLLPFLMIAWINIHGAWVVGIFTIGLYLVCGLTELHVGNLETRRWNALERRNLALVFALSVFALALTPYGLGLAKVALDANSKLPVAFENIQEWRPIAFQALGDKLFLGLVLGFLLMLVAVRPKWRLEEMALFLFGAEMAFSHVRFLFLCAAIFAPIVVVVLAPWIPKYDRTQELYVLNAAIIVSLLAAMVWYFPSRDYYSHSVQESFPVMAVQYLNTHSVPGPMYNSYYFGGYLIFARGPEHKVFIDGRGDVYERAGVFSDQVALVNLKPGFLAILQKYNIQSCLLSPGDGLSTTLAALPEWQQAYTDDQSVIFVRRPSEVSEERDVRATQMEHAASRPL